MFQLHVDRNECLLFTSRRWKGFDISGHCFLLTWSNLFVIEEARAYLGWERIKDMIRNEEHRRLNTDILLSRGKDGGGDTALSKLSLDEFLHLRRNYKVYSYTAVLISQVVSRIHLHCNIVSKVFQMS